MLVDNREHLIHSYFHFLIWSKAICWQLLGFLLEPLRALRAMIATTVLTLFVRMHIAHFYRHSLEFLC